MKTVKCLNHDVRFMNVGGEWCPVFTDICEALELSLSDIEKYLDSVEGEYVQLEDKTWTLAVSEVELYKAMLISKKPEASQFRRWSGNIMKKFRELAGLEGYEAIRMMDADVQDKIERIIDTLYYDAASDQLMVSITVTGGDVEQIPLYSE